MQEAGDGLILVAAVLQHECADPQQMGEIGDRGTLSHLPAVGLGRVIEGVVKARESLHAESPPGSPLIIVARQGRHGRLRIDLNTLFPMFRLARALVPSAHGSRRMIRRSPHFKA